MTMATLVTDKKTGVIRPIPKGDRFHPGSPKGEGRRPKGSRKGAAGKKAAAKKPRGKGKATATAPAPAPVPEPRKPGDAKGALGDITAHRRLMLRLEGKIKDAKADLKKLVDKHKDAVLRVFGDIDEAGQGLLFD